MIKSPPVEPPKSPGPTALCPLCRGPLPWLVALLVWLAPGCCPPPPPASPGPAARAACPPCGGTAIQDAALREVLARGGVDPDQVKCNTRVAWDRTLDGYAGQIVDGLARRWIPGQEPGERGKDLHFVLGYLVRSYFEQVRNDNLGAMVLKGRSYRDEGGLQRPVLVFRSGLTAQTGGVSPCFQSLLGQGRVRHVVNLYAGSFPFNDLVDAEHTLASRAGVEYFDLRSHPELRYRSLVEKPEDYATNLARAQQNLAQLIREQILRPGGSAPRGNIYFHCAGGMHRSGILFGVLRRCVNGDSMEQITREYKRHVAFTSAQEPGGFEPLNLRFIREFDCRLLEAAR